MSTIETHITICSQFIFLTLCNVVQAIGGSFFVHLECRLKYEPGSFSILCPIPTTCFFFKSLNFCCEMQMNIGRTWGNDGSLSSKREKSFPDYHANSKIGNIGPSSCLTSPSIKTDVKLVFPQLPFSQPFEGAAQNGHIMDTKSSQNQKKYSGICD